MHPYLTFLWQTLRPYGVHMLQALERMDTVHMDDRARWRFAERHAKHCERWLMDAVAETYPEHQVQGKLLGVERDVAASVPEEERVVWHVQGLTGYLNFMRALPDIGVVVTVSVGGDLRHAFLFFPAADTYLAASRGRGTLSHQRRMRVAQRQHWSQMLVADVLPELHHADLMPSQAAPLNPWSLLPSAVSRRLSGCSTLDWSRLASGQVDLLVGQNVLAAEQAAGVLVAEEAGAVVVDLHGQPVDWSQDRVTFLAGNPRQVGKLFQRQREQEAS